MKIDLTSVIGLRDIAGHMLQPPVDPGTGRVAGKLGEISLKQLLARHRFAPGQQPSFGEIARRWRPDDGSKALHVLSFNTFLMDLEFNIFEVLDELLPGGSFFESLVGAAIGYATGGVGGALEGAVLGAKVSAAREALEKAEDLLDPFRITKPDVKARAYEIGAMLASERFDLAVLMEVWSPAEQGLVTLGIQATGGTLTEWTSGALPGEASAGSGLMTIGLTADLGQHLFLPYVYQGAANQDTDYYSRKGVLLVRIPLGFGEIDFYSTHLYWGNDIPEVPPVTSAPTDQQRIGWRLLQLEQMKQFIQATHKSTNVAILAGDFNIDAHGSPHAGGFDLLVSVTASLGLDDEWLQQFDASSVAHGGTDCMLNEKVFDCVAAAKKKADQQPRLDYLFVERPKAQHTFHLDVTRIELRDFPRPQFDKHASLSDHRGLAYSLVCGPKR